jgi:hypothetical protein
VKHKNDWEGKMKNSHALFIFILCGAVILSACTFGPSQANQIPTTSPISTATPNKPPTPIVTPSPNPTPTPDRTMALKACAIKLLQEVYGIYFLTRYTITASAEEVHVVAQEPSCETVKEYCLKEVYFCTFTKTIFLIRWSGSQCIIEDKSTEQDYFKDCPAPTWAPDEPRKIELSELLTTSAITILDDWSGLSLLAPKKKHYSLKREDNQFQGNASFSIGEYSGNPRTGSMDIQIPAEVMEKFYAKLTETIFDKGYYRPTFEHTDDYPEISIDLTTDNGSIQFMTTSQGDYHTPWKVIFQRNGQSTEYRTDSTAPFEALTLLEPYLGNDIFEQLVEEFEKEIRP